MELTSARNPRLQSIRRAAATGRPTEEGLVVAEGPHLLEEAQTGRWAIQQVFATSHARERYRHLFEKTDAEVVEVSERAFASVTGTETPQNILTLLRPSRWSWSDLQPPDATGSAGLVILDRVQDPGNVGTIVRSAEAFGATGIVFLKGCARVANGKVLRAAAGSLFRMPFLEEVGTADLLSKVQSDHLKLYALSPQGRTPAALADWLGSFALVVGSEGQGVSQDLRSGAEGISIPTGQVESLNAAVACSIALYEAWRQRFGT